MVIASTNPMKIEKIREDIELPIIDLHSDRSQASLQIVKACEQYGFFKVLNHGVPQEIIARMEEEAQGFFAKPGSEKQRAGPANPYGYGCKNIGLKGDIGEVEYLLLQTNTPFISHKSKCISTDPNKFSYAVIGYVEAVRELACEILDLMWEGLGGPEASALSGLIRDAESDSLLRLNHYPSADVIDHPSPPKIGFGEHTDPQILTLLRSNGVHGLQISLEDGVWVPVNPYPESAFFVNVGDVLQVMTNGRFLSVRHRVVVNSYNSRLSMAYFAAPSLDVKINCLSELATPQKPPLYRSFTWGEYKKATYMRRLGDSRLNLFKLQPDDEKRDSFC
ncbi:Iron/ascorbate family oxidoreductase [Handroanthus impetiginosus]|uniref:gibberellin 2beta-dioxygenase n=1 Tax=Handroanthus impetiginosus TaxID=429701 RepID=A0A2G9HKZ6_9LAMI|nr:Iron/ascorbate family oxidoreductase [Handroanthus impetiginosus]